MAINDSNDSNMDQQQPLALTRPLILREHQTAGILISLALLAVCWIPILLLMTLWSGGLSTANNDASSTLSNAIHHHPAAPHIIVPRRSNPSISNITLRDYLLHPDGVHLAMAPSFFGFYGYFGALAGVEEMLFEKEGEGNDNDTIQSSQSLLIQHSILKSVTGASAGAMAAILLAAGISPSLAAEFCTSIRLEDFLDFSGFFSFLKGDKFEDIMQDFLHKASPLTNGLRKQEGNNNRNTTLTIPHSLQLEDALIPVAVSAFDLQTLKGKLLSKGSMARAARASACFPFLFEPVGWIDFDTSDSFLFVDGGLGDVAGLAGLEETMAAYAGVDNQQHQQNQHEHRVLNMVVGDFLMQVPGPSSMPKGLTSSSVLSVSIQNLPQCGPWAMENGPLAVEAARSALKQSLDLPLYLGEEEGHYELHIDASSFVPDATTVA